MPQTRLSRMRAHACPVSWPATNSRVQAAVSRRTQTSTPRNRPSKLSTQRVRLQETAQLKEKWSRFLRQVNSLSDVCLLLKFHHFLVFPKYILRYPKENWLEQGEQPWHRRPTDEEETNRSSHCLISPYRDVSIPQLEDGLVNIRAVINQRLVGVRGRNRRRAPDRARRRPPGHKDRDALDRGQ